MLRTNAWYGIWLGDRLVVHYVPRPNLTSESHVNFLRKTSIFVVSATWMFHNTNRVKTLCEIFWGKWIGTVSEYISHARTPNLTTPATFSCGVTLKEKLASISRQVVILVLRKSIKEFNKRTISMRRKKDIQKYHMLTISFSVDLHLITKALLLCFPISRRLENFTWFRATFYSSEIVLCYAHLFKTTRADNILKLGLQFKRNGPFKK